MIIKGINDIPGFSCINPKGAFYAFPNIKNFKMNSLKFSRWLLKEAMVAVVPGTEFGRMGEGYIRCSYATDYNKIKTALDRIEKATEKLRV